MTIWDGYSVSRSTLLRIAASARRARWGPWARLPAGPIRLCSRIRPAPSLRRSFAAGSP